MAKTLKIEVRNVKEYPGMSEETNCFSATIYVGGKLAADVRNDGRGGCHRYHWNDPKVRTQVEAWAERQPTEFDFEKLDQIIDRLVHRQSLRKFLAQRCKTRIIYRRLRGETGDGWNSYVVKYTANLAAQIRAKHGPVIIANEDLDAAADLYVELLSRGESSKTAIRK